MFQTHKRKIFDHQFDTYNLVSDVGTLNEVVDHFVNSWEVLTKMFKCFWILNQGNSTAGLPEIIIEELIVNNFLKQHSPEIETNISPLFLASRQKLIAITCDFVKFGVWS